MTSQKVFGCGFGCGVGRWLKNCDRVISFAHLFISQLSNRFEILHTARQYPLTAETSVWILLEINHETKNLQREHNPITNPAPIYW